MTTPNPVRTDRLDAARYPVVANQLHAEARGYMAIAVSVSPCRAQFDTFAEPVANLLRKHYEELAVALEAMAETAQGFADQARERLGIPA